MWQKATLRFGRQFAPTEQQKAAGYDTAEKVYDAWRTDNKYRTKHEGKNRDEINRAILYAEDEAEAHGHYSHAEGCQAVAVGSASHAEGYYTRAEGEYSHAEGWKTKASGPVSHAEGSVTTASGSYSHAEGSDTTASGSYSHAEGYFTKASGPASHAEGASTTASGDCSHAEGSDTTASGSYSHAEGTSTAEGNNSHAEGYKTTASGTQSHAEGSETIAEGVSSHAEGRVAKAVGHHSHAEGSHTVASADCSHVQGKWNIKDTKEQYAHIVGNGTKDAPSNAHTLDWKGNAWFQGKVTTNGADYAEFFEWADGNPTNEDRVGYLVALDGEKIKLASVGDDIIGVISGTAAVLGDNSGDV